MKNKKRIQQIDENTCEMVIKKRNGNKYRVLFDAEDLPTIEAHNWFISTKGYVKTRMDYIDYGMPEILLGRKSNHHWMFDHINGDRRDNRKSNLWFVSRSVNNANRTGKARNNTGVRGIQRSPEGYYRIRDSFKNRTKPYKTIEEAALAKMVSLAQIGIPISRYGGILDADLSPFEPHLKDLILLKFLHSELEEQ